MTLLFVHSHKFRLINNKLYSPGSLNNEVLTRYTDLFGKVIVVARILKESVSTNSLSEITNKDVIIKGFNEIGMKGLKKEVENADYVISRLPSLIGNKAIEIAIKQDKPYLVEVVGCPWDSYRNHSLKGKIVAPYMWYKTRKIVAKSAFAVYVTNNFLQNRYPCKGETISCSDVELLNLDEKILKKRLNKMESINDRPIVIGTTAAVNVRYKGQEYVIKAISKLKEQGYNFQYNIAGGGDSTYLESISYKYGVSDKVKFLGPLPHNKVFDFLDEVDIYVQPSKLEGLPRALIEALSRGCPSIGSLAGGIPELLNNDFMFHIGDVNEICNLLIKLDKETMINEAKRSFEKAKEYDKRLLDKKRNGFYSSFKGNN